MTAHPLTERTRGIIFLSSAVFLAAIFSWYPLYCAHHASGIFSFGGLLVVYGLPVHFITAWIAVRGFCLLLVPVIQGHRSSRDWGFLLIGSGLALAGLSPLLIFAWAVTR